VRGTGIESVTAALSGEGTFPNPLFRHPCCDVNTRRTKLLDLVGLQLVADVTQACAVLSADMAAQRTKH
jgi:hypothetical protein